MATSSDLPLAIPGATKPQAPRGVPFDDVVDILQTGDLLLFQGENTISREIEIATGSPFSHCAMVIRHSLRDVPMIWQAGPGGIVVDPVEHVKHGGAQLGDLREALALMEDPKYHDTCFLRRMTVERPEGFDDAALAVVAELDGRPFPSIRDMVEHFVLGKLLHIVTNEKTMFCAELVARTYMGMALLPPAPPANGYAPGAFGAKNRSLRLEKAANLGPEIRIERPGAPATSPAPTASAAPTKSAVPTPSAG